MRATFTLVLSLTVALTLFVAGFFSASALMAKPAPVALASIDVPDLWPAAPKRVVAAEQTLERVPAAPVATLQASGALPLSQPPIVATASSEIDQSRPGAAASTDEIALSPQPAVHNPEHQAWCERRYRSYRAADDSYSAYSGERKICISPYSDVASSTGRIEPASEDMTASDTASRCQARYASYRASDNTYQPYGGPRRLCAAN